MEESEKRNVFREILDEDQIREEARRDLRGMELQAYSKMMTALRAEGKLDKEKKGVLDGFRKYFGITEARHIAEMRRANCNLRVTQIAERLHDGDPSDPVDESWSCEAYNVFPPLPTIPRRGPKKRESVSVSTVTLDDLAATKNGPVRGKVDVELDPVDGESAEMARLRWSLRVKKVHKKVQTRVSYKTSLRPCSGSDSDDIDLDRRSPDIIDGATSPEKREGRRRGRGGLKIASRKLNFPNRAGGKTPNYGRKLSRIIKKKPPNVNASASNSRPSSTDDEVEERRERLLNNNESLSMSAPGARGRGLPRGRGYGGGGGGRSRGRGVGRGRGRGRMTMSNPNAMQMAHQHPISLASAGTFPDSDPSSSPLNLTTKNNNSHAHPSTTATTSASTPRRSQAATSSASRSLNKKWRPKPLKSPSSSASRRKSRLKEKEDDDLRLEWNEGDSPDEEDVGLLISNKHIPIKKRKLLQGGEDPYQEDDRPSFLENGNNSNSNSNHHLSPSPTKLAYHHHQHQHHLHPNSSYHLAPGDHLPLPSYHGHVRRSPCSGEETDSASEKGSVSGSRLPPDSPGQGQGSPPRQKQRLKSPLIPSTSNSTLPRVSIPPPIFSTTLLNRKKPPKPLSVVESLNLSLPPTASSLACSQRRAPIFSNQATMVLQRQGGGAGSPGILQGGQRKPTPHILQRSFVQVPLPPQAPASQNSVSVSVSSSPSSSSSVTTATVTSASPPLASLTAVSVPSVTSVTMCPVPVPVSSGTATAAIMQMQLPASSAGRGGPATPIILVQKAKGSSPSGNAVVPVPVPTTLASNTILLNFDSHSGGYKIVK